MNMQCARAEKLIPLFAGDDLSAREADALRRHLEFCANCRRLATEFEESRDWLRRFAAPQIDEPMLEGLRDSVLREIGRIENRTRWIQWILPGLNLRLAFASLLASLLLGGMLSLMINRRQSPYDPKYNQAQTRKSGDYEATTPSSKTPGERRNDGAIRKSDRRKFRRKPIQSGPTEAPQPEERMVESDLIAQNMDAAEPAADQSAGDDPANTDPGASQDMLRIEIQTADPNIRIIWFALKSDMAPTAPNAK